MHEGVFCSIREMFSNRTLIGKTSQTHTHSPFLVFEHFYYSGGDNVVTGFIESLSVWALVQLNLFGLLWWNWKRPDLPALDAPTPSDLAVIT